MINPNDTISDEREKRTKFNPLTKHRTPTFLQLAKSRSNEFNVIIAPAIIGILTACGITVPVGVIIGGYAVVNFVLRWITKKPLSEK